MSDLYSVHNIVKQILVESKQARNSDSFLYYKVLKRIGECKGIDIDNMSVPHLFLNLKTYGLPIFETVRRARQKIQHDDPELAACKAVKEAREENEEVFREYAKAVIE